MTITNNWINLVEEACRKFASQHSFAYSRTEREMSASFEIGCFHALLEFYESTSQSQLKPENIQDGKYRYLTTPNGNPDNFSYVRIEVLGRTFALRQQVRIRSHLHSDIAFTPDMVVLAEGATIRAVNDRDYASEKRKFFSVNSSDVVAAHECKSMNPFPELLVSFIGHVMAAHEWLKRGDLPQVLAVDGIHLAPTLFIGGAARALHLRMVDALENCFPMNILVGMHAGNWRLSSAKERLKRLVLDPREDAPRSSAVEVVRPRRRLNL